MKVTEVAQRINYLLYKIGDETIKFSELKELESLLSQSHEIIKISIEKEKQIRKANNQ